MSNPSMMTLDDYSWLGSSAGLDVWRSLSTRSRPATPTAIRSEFGCTSSQAELLFEQHLFAVGKGKDKVEQPHRWFWTRQLLEQSSDEWTAQETARDAPLQTPHWIDACCGAGSDAIALARRRAGVLAVDIQPMAILLARANAKMNEVELDLHSGDIESFSLEQDSFLNIDPDRRPDGERTIDPFRSQPTWNWISQAVHRLHSVSLKLAPGFRLQPDFAWGEARRPQTIRWLSWGGSVRQQRWYWGVDRWLDDCRVVSAGNSRVGWHHEVFPSTSESHVSGTAEYIQDSQRLSSGFVADQDPVIRAAAVGASLAKRLGVQCIGDRHGYFYSPHPVAHPMLRWFEILTIVAMDVKKVRAVARSMPVSVWELKSRGIEIDLPSWRRGLPVEEKADQQRTILFTRVGKRHIAIFARRAETESSNPC